MYGLEPFGGPWGGFLSDLVRVPWADQMLVPLPDGIDPVVIASLSDNIPDGWRTVTPYVTDPPNTSVMVVAGAGPSIQYYAIRCGQGARRRTDRTGWATLPVDPDSVRRFLAKCAPCDDQGHVWWLGGIDGRADRRGGYGRFQAGRGAEAVITTAHRYAWTVACGPIPEGLVVRHRCDEPLCVAIEHLIHGTMTENRWDALLRPVRAADRDLRGSAGRSRATSGPSWQ